MKKTIKIISFVLLFVLLVGTCSALFFLNKTEEKKDDIIPGNRYEVYGVGNVGQASPTLKRLECSSKYFYFMMNDGRFYSSFNDAYPYCDIKEITDGYGNEFVKIPKFYTSIKTHEDGTFDLLISGFKYDGFTTLFTDDKGNEVDYILIGKYEGAINTDETEEKRIVSQKNLTPETEITFDNAGTLCNVNGVGYHQFNYKAYNIVQQLFLVEFATTNSQAVFSGVTCQDSCALTGEGFPEIDNILYSNSIGYLNRANGSFNYRGIENVWGNIFTWVDGVSMTSDAKSISGDFGTVTSDVDTSLMRIDRLAPISKTAYLGFPTELGRTNYMDCYYCDSYYIAENTNYTLRLAVGGSFASSPSNTDFSGLFRMCWIPGHFGVTTVPSTGCRLCYTPVVVG